MFQTTYLRAAVARCMQNKPPAFPQVTGGIFFVVRHCIWNKCGVVFGVLVFRGELPLAFALLCILYIYSK